MIKHLLNPMQHYTSKKWELKLLLEVVGFVPPELRLAYGVKFEFYVWFKINCQIQMGRFEEFYRNPGALHNQKGFLQAAFKGQKTGWE